MAIRIQILTETANGKQICTLLLFSGSATSAAPEPTRQQANAPSEESSKIPNDQLDSLVAPIALYPDPLLAQTLAASTYPLELIQLQQWLARKLRVEGQGACRCCREAALGSKYPGDGGAALIW